MPRYVYECSACEERFEVSHSMSHEQDECKLCGSLGTLKKIPSFLLRSHQGASKQRTGQVVDDYIRDAKMDLAKQKRQLKTETLD